MQMEPQTTETELEPVQVGEEALRSFSHLPEARQLTDYESRLAADQDLVHRLEWAGFTGPDWDELAAALVAYGVQVIRAWIISGRIFLECRAKHLGGDLMKEQDPEWGSTDPDELAWDTNTDALRAFRDNVLLKHRWTSAKGASLKTFYVGQALIQWVATYRRWVRSRRSIPSGLADEYAQTLKVVGPEPAVVLRDTVAAEMADIKDPRTRHALILTSQGYRQDEIAELLGLDSGRAVEALLYRQRQRRRLRLGA
jgi:hypothetical protein